MIIDHLHDDPTALAACSLTCREWTPTTRVHLFNTVILDSHRKMASFDAILHGGCVTLPGIAHYVRSLTIGMKAAEFASSEITDDLIIPDGEQRLERQREIEKRNFPRPTRILEANGYIICISEHLKNVRSLSLEHINFAQHLCQIGTIECIVAMSRDIQSLRLSAILFDNLGQVIQLMQSSCLTSISMQGVSTKTSSDNNNYFVQVDPRSPCMHQAIPSTSILSLELLGCSNPLFIVRYLHTPSFKLDLRKLSVYCDKDLVLELLRDGAGDALENLQLDCAGFDAGECKFHGS